MNDWVPLNIIAMWDRVAWYQLDESTVAFALRIPELVPIENARSDEPTQPPTITRASVIYGVARKRLAAARAGLTDDRTGWTWRLGPGVPRAIALERPAGHDIPVADPLQQTLFGVPIIVEPAWPPDAIRLEVRW